MPDFMVPNNPPGSIRTDWLFDIVFKNFRENLFKGESSGYSAALEEGATAWANVTDKEKLLSTAEKKEKLGDADGDIRTAFLDEDRQAREKASTVAVVGQNLQSHRRTKRKKLRRAASSITLSAEAEATDAGEENNKQHDQEQQSEFQGRANDDDGAATDGGASTEKSAGGTGKTFFDFLLFQEVWGFHWDMVGLRTRLLKEREIDCSPVHFGMRVNPAGMNSGLLSCYNTNEFTLLSEFKFSDAPLEVQFSTENAIGTASQHPDDSGWRVGAWAKRPDLTLDVQHAGFFFPVYDYLFWGFFFGFLTIVLVASDSWLFLCGDAKQAARDTVAADIATRSSQLSTAEENEHHPLRADDPEEVEFAMTDERDKKGIVGFLSIYDHSVVLGYLLRLMLVVVSVNFFFLLFGPSAAKIIDGELLGLVFAAVDYMRDGKLGLRHLVVGFLHVFSICTIVALVFSTHKEAGAPSKGTAGEQGQNGEAASSLDTKMKEPEPQPDEVSGKIDDVENKRGLQLQGDRNSDTAPHSNTDNQSKTASSYAPARPAKNVHLRACKYVLAFYALLAGTALLSAGFSFRFVWWPEPALDSSLAPDASTGWLYHRYSEVAGDDTISAKGVVAGVLQKKQTQQTFVLFNTHVQAIPDSGAIFQRQFGANLTSEELHRAKMPADQPGLLEEDEKKHFRILIHQYKSLALFMDAVVKQARQQYGPDVHVVIGGDLNFHAPNLYYADTVARIFGQPRLQHTPVNSYFETDFLSPFSWTDGADALRMVTGMQPLIAEKVFGTQQPLLSPACVNNPAMADREYDIDEKTGVFPLNTLQDVQAKKLDVENVCAGTGAAKIAWDSEAEAFGQTAAMLDTANFDQIAVFPWPHYKSSNETASGGASWTEASSKNSSYSEAVATSVEQEQKILKTSSVAEGAQQESESGEGQVSTTASGSLNKRYYRTVRTWVPWSELVESGTENFAKVSDHFPVVSIAVAEDVPPPRAAELSETAEQRTTRLQNEERAARVTGDKQLQKWISLLPMLLILAGLLVLLPGILITAKHLVTDRKKEIVEDEQGGERRSFVERGATPVPPATPQGEGAEPERFHSAVSAADI
ncbi:unnamed protein product [Amoebophrya sp. A120]|nr:unnamed protein product [Amoebophrya sp. A120]|eukprot:GSA120T00005534001.1